MDDHPVHTIPNHHPTKMEVLPKTFVKIVLPAKFNIQVQYVLNQQRRPFAFSSVFIVFLWGTPWCKTCSYHQYLSLNIKAVHNLKKTPLMTENTASVLTAFPHWKMNILSSLHLLPLQYISYIRQGQGLR